jgi:quinone-modifying oxidoreductase, subunit QmoB
VKARASDSVFLTRNEPGDRDFSRVLVLGGDETGVRLARRLVEENFKVLLLSENDDTLPDRDISVIPEAALEEVQGFAGDFHVVMRTSAGRFKEWVGAIIAAQPPLLAPKFAEYGVEADSQALSLTELELKMRAGESLGKPRGQWFHAAFLFGLEGESDPTVFSRTLGAIERLQSVSQVQCYVFTRNLKVAAAGLERRYREARENGVLFFKFDGEGPAFERTADGLAIAFREPLLGTEMELAPDLLVVDERHLPPSGLEPLWNSIPSSPCAVPYLQQDSPRFPSVETPKAGILSVGASRGVFWPDQVDSDIEAAVYGLKKLEASSAPLKGPGPAVIDPEKCTICLTCVRLCPHGAISFTRSAYADPMSCMRCGICAAACPMCAITLQPATPGKDVTLRIGEQLQHEAGKRLVIFLCSHSGAQALQYAGDTIRDSAALVEVPCVGTVDVAHILAAFQSGARGVIVTGCFKGNCTSVYGTSLAEEKAHQAGMMLAEVGVNPDLVTFVPLAGNTPGALVKAVREMQSRVDCTNP